MNRWVSWAAGLTGIQLVALGLVLACLLGVAFCLGHWLGEQDAS